ncbi:WhiB family transcriptional regulator [Nakamurella sp. YIM 132084]|uniref:Transcriptional regulator WhiB n=2 Tax=Nakamurella leprariae TaxID=2803911 RepID=A0A939C1M9_9ACTN|nr:WhiB family transcriptional regulator [Nakamurella leprariae]
MSTVPSVAGAAAPTTEFIAGAPQHVSNSSIDVGSALPCAQADPDLFFAERPDDLERAKAVCGPCPARAACLAAALDRSEPWGVWGGEIFDQGVIIARKRARGRPRKVAA